MRLTVNLDEETSGLLEDLTKSAGVSKSQVVRDALAYYHQFSNEWSHVTQEQMEWYIRLLSGTEHRILDVDHVDTLLAEIDSTKSLEPEWREIGRKHGVEWRNQFDSLKKKLRVLEYCNWYTITEIDDNEYALTFEDETEAKLIGAFIRGECDELGFDIDVRQISRKLVVAEADSR